MTTARKGDAACMQASGSLLPAAGTESGGWVVVETCCAAGWAAGTGGGTATTAAAAPPSIASAISALGLSPIRHLADFGAELQRHILHTIATACAHPDFQSGIDL
jgi:hypothetical protein